MKLRHWVFLALFLFVLLPLVVLHPQQSFSLFAGLLITFSTTSTLIFFAFVTTVTVLGFGRRANRQVPQAAHTHTLRTAQEDGRA